jgi:hypothetical protein
MAYDSNDVVAFYLYGHWQIDYKGWRREPGHRLLINSDSSTFTCTAVRQMFRHFLSLWYFKSDTPILLANEILDNCFGNVLLYRQWVTETKVPDRSIYTYKMDLGSVLLLLPVHKPLI